MLLQDGEGAAKAAHCRFERVLKMLAADCSGLNFPQVPQVQRQIEVKTLSIIISTNQAIIMQEKMHTANMRKEKIHTDHIFIELQAGIIYL